MSLRVVPKIQTHSNYEPRTSHESKYKENHASAGSKSAAAKQSKPSPSSGRGQRGKPSVGPGDSDATPGDLYGDQAFKEAIEQASRDSQDSREDSEQGNDAPCDLSDMSKTSEQPIISELAPSLINPASLVASLGQQIAEFCNNSVVLDLGSWQVQMQLDQKRFGNTTLHLSLSRYYVQLRFDAPEAHIREALLSHTHALHGELSQTLNALGEAREVDILVE